VPDEEFPEAEFEALDAALRADPERHYRYQLTIVRVLQRQGWPNRIIEAVYGITLKPEDRCDENDD
jgi:hypothetical protein